MIFPSASRCRKRFRSESRKGIQASRRKFGGGPPDSVQLFCRMFGNCCLKSYLWKIDCDYLKKLSEVDCSYYHRHNHSDKNSDCFRDIESNNTRFLSATPDRIPRCYIATIGSTVYSVLLNRGSVTEFKSMELNVNPDLIREEEKWTELPYPNCNVISAYRLKPKLVSLRGTLFLLGADPAALVFDPRTKSWSELKGPGGVRLEMHKISFSASLGESYGKILFLDRKREPDSASYIYIYDVVSKEWDIYDGLSLVENCILLDKLVIGNAVVNKQEKHTIYWLHVDGYIYAFDWKERCLSKGIILGMEHEHLDTMLKLSCYISFLHIWGDVFGLFWAKHYGPATDSDFHLTFLRVIKDGHNNSLKAYVVGCFRDTVPGMHECCEATLLDPGAEEKEV